MLTTPDVVETCAGGRVDEALVRRCWEIEQLEGKYRRLIVRLGTGVEVLLVEVVKFESRLL
ncbi:MAG: hypothetical protein V3U68_05895 [Bacteroidota bacterium]